MVALGGVFAAWTTRTWETLGESGEEQIEAVTGQLQKSIAIDSAFCDGVGLNSVAYVRNTGSSALTLADLSVYVDRAGGGYELVNAGPIGLSIDSGAVGEVTGLGTLATDDKIKITTSGNSATHTCD